jgi:hypothetical protein
MNVNGILGVYVKYAFRILILQDEWDMATKMLNNDNFK